jgi:PST family polysaccharide transporter
VAEDGETGTAPIRGTAVSGAFYLGLSQIVRLVLTVLSTIIIARLLSPDDYGVMAMCAPVLGFLLMFQDLGLGTATVQQKTISDDQLNALFWINVLASMALAVILVAIAPGVAWFYGDVRAGYVTAAGAVGTLIGGTSLQHNALLNRNLRFGVLSASEIAGAVVTFLVAAALAFLLRSYWALVIGSTAGMATSTAIVWHRSPWRPRWRVSVAGAGGSARMGGHVTTFNFVNFFSRNADNILLGRFAGVDAVGLYDRSYKLMMLPLQSVNGPLSRLLMPLLSRMTEEPARYRRTYTFSLRALVLATVPGIAVATMFSDQLMPFLLGARWAGAGPIFFWLGLAGILQPVHNLLGLLFLSTGRSRPYMHWGVINAAITVAGFVAGMPWGPAGVAASFFLTTAARTPVIFAAACHGSPVRVSDLYAAHIGPIAGAAIACALVSIVGAQLGTGVLMILGIALAYILAVGCSLLTPGGRATIRQLAGLGAEGLGAIARRRAGRITRLAGGAA